MPDSQIPTVRKGLKQIAAALGISIAKVYVAMQDPTFPVRRIDSITLTDDEALRQWLGVQAEAKEPSKEQLDASVRRVMREKFGEG